MAIADLPFIQPNHLQHIGSFALPTARQPSGDPSIEVGSAGCGFAYAGESIAYNAANNSLFITGSEQDGFTLAEIGIPSTLYTGTNRTLLPTAPIIQNFRRIDPAMGRAKDIANWGSNMVIQGIQGTFLSNILVYNGRLIGSVSIYYDGGYVARKSHFYLDSLNLATANASPLCLVKVSNSVNTQGSVAIQDIGEGPEIHHAGNVGMHMGHIPAEWRAQLGNVPCYTGSCGLAIISRTSAGPNAHGFDPDNLAPSTPLRSKLYQQFNVGGPHWGYDTDDPFYVANYGGVVTEWGGPPSDPAPNKRKRFFSASNFTGCFVAIPGTRTVIETNAGGSPLDWMIYGHVRPSDGHLMAGSLPVGHPFFEVNMTDTVDGRTATGNYAVPRHPTDPWGILPQQTRWERRIRFWDANDWATVYNGSSANQDAARPYASTPWVTPVTQVQESAYYSVAGGAVDPVNKIIYLVARYDNIVSIFSSQPVIHAYSYASALTNAPTTRGTDGEQQKIGIIR